MHYLKNKNKLYIKKKYELNIPMNPAYCVHIFYYGASDRVKQSQ